MDIKRWKEKVFSPKNDILVKGLALFEYELYKDIEVNSNISINSSEKIELKISNDVLEKQYNITTLKDHENEEITITNLVDEGIIKDLSNEECIFEILETAEGPSKTVGKLKLDLPIPYSLSHFQLSCDSDDKGIFSFAARDVFNDKVFATHFEQKNAAKQIKAISKSKKDLIKLNVNAQPLKRIKILAKNGNDINAINRLQENVSEKIKIGSNKQEKAPDKIKIKISKSDLKERTKTALISPKITKNENTIVEDFNELIRIIVINNSP